MALKISMHEIQRLKEQAERMKKRVAGATERSHETIATLVRTAEVGAAAFGFGVVQGRYGGIEVVGVPIDLGAGLLAHLGAMMGIGGNMSGHLHSFGDGALAAYLTTLGRGTGLGWKSGSKQIGGKSTTGSLSAGQKQFMDANVRPSQYATDEQWADALVHGTAPGSNFNVPAKKAGVKGDRLTQAELEELANPR